MDTTDQSPRVGPFRLVRPLSPGKLAERWLALDERDNSTHVLHRFDLGGDRLGGDRAERRRFLAAIEEASALRHPHLLAVKTFSMGTGVSAGAAWVVTPYTGSQEGLLTLSQLVRSKGGSLSPVEAERAVEQLLEAMTYAHAADRHHGPLSAEEVLVDRRGSLAIEMYGLRRRLAGFSSGNAELVRDEVRSVVELAYRLLTGLPADEPRIPAGRLVRKLDPRWDEWLEMGLDPTGGFATAFEALQALPSRAREFDRRERVGPVRVVLSRFRRAMGATRPGAPGSNA